MTKGAKSNRGVSNVRKIGEHHLQNRNISNNWCANGGDEEEDGSGEEEKGADMVKGAGMISSHFGSLLNRSR